MELVYVSLLQHMYCNLHIIGTDGTPYLTALGEHTFQAMYVSNPNADDQPTQMFPVHCIIIALSSVLAKLIYRPQNGRTKPEVGSINQLNP